MLAEKENFCTLFLKKMETKYTIGLRIPLYSVILNIYGTHPKYCMEQVIFKDGSYTYMGFTEWYWVAEQKKVKCRVRVS
jgi:hypothetical protein